MIGSQGLLACTPIFILAFLTIYVSAQTPANWTEHIDIRTGRKVVVTSLFTSSNVPTLLTYNITYSGGLSGTTRAGLGITGFKAQMTYDLSINMTIENFTANWMRISVGVLGDTSVQHVAVNWIAVGDQVDFLQVFFDCFLCGTISTGNGSRSEGRSQTTLFTGYDYLEVTVHIAGFQLHNSQGLRYYLCATASIQNTTNVIDYIFSTDENNTVTSICYTTLVFCQQITEILWYNWGEMGRQDISNSVTPSVFAPNSTYQDSNRMFFGMSCFSLSRDVIRWFDFDTETYNNLTNNYQSNSGTYKVTIDYFWIAVRSCDDNGNGGNQRWFHVTSWDCYNDNSCPAGTQQTTPGRFCHVCHYTCKTCDGAHEGNCTACEPLDFRVDPIVNSTCPCEDRYIDVGVSLCQPCQYYIPGCKICTTTSVCTSCFGGWILQSSAICGCTTGFLVSGICINITGCTSAVEYGGNVQCLACNSTLNFENTNFTCVCSSAYYSSANEECLSLCGDGLKASDEGCDNGNTQDGDGCSASCSVEDNWICFNGTTTTPSNCYINNNFTMEVKYIKRILTGNIMQVGIKISPSYNEFTTINYKNFMTHNVPHSDYNATYQNGLLILDFQYTRTIQGEDFLVSFSFDPDIFYNTSVSLTLPASGINAELTYDSLNHTRYPLQIITIIVSILALLVLFASAFSERMIGIEMIQTLQTCLFTQMVMKSLPSSLAPLQNLKYTNGFNQIAGIDDVRTYSLGFNLSSIGLEKEFLLSINLMYIILLLVIAVCIILKAKQIYHENKAGKIADDEQFGKNQEKWRSTTKIFNFIFERIFFVFGFLLMFLITAAMMVMITDMQADYLMLPKELNYLCGGVAMAIMATLICSVIITSIYPGTLIFPMLMKQYYPAIYFIYQSSFIFILVFVYTQTYILYILGSMSFLFLIYNIIHRPYPQKFHTFVLVIHQLIIILFIMLLIFNERTTDQNEQFLVIMGFVFIFLLLIVVFLNLYRLIRHLRFLKNKNWDQYGNQIEQSLPQQKNYHPLVTPRNQINYFPKKTSQVKQPKTSKSNVRNKGNEQSQMKPIKKRVKDEKDYKWNINKLVDDEERINPTPRIDAINSSRSNKINLANDSRNNKQLHNSKTIKNIHDDEETIGKNKYADDDDESLEQNSQVNNDGFPKNKMEEQDEDPLKLIKMKLRQDFANKIKSNSAVKEI